ncbi:MAG: hypothetical protein DRP54_04310 [Spirochaetes bacterium]|nr:MAG: hypothetical protein DRP54_04310 [Spirochaetota bacterium]
MRKSLKYCIPLIILMVLFTSAAGYSQEVYYGKKDPVLAGALSWYVPGLGQVYGGSVIKGAMFWIAEQVLLYGTIVSFAELKLEVTRNIDIGLNITSHENPTKEEKRRALLMGSALVVLHFYNIIDAVNTSIKYNRQYSENVSIDVYYNEETMSYGFGLKSFFKGKNCGH